MLHEKYQTLVSFPRMRVIEGAPMKENKKTQRKRRCGCFVKKLSDNKDGFLSLFVNKTALLLPPKKVLLTTAVLLLVFSLFLNQIWTSVLSETVFNLFYRQLFSKSIYKSSSGCINKNVHSGLAHVCSYN